MKDLADKYCGVDAPKKRGRPAKFTVEKQKSLSHERAKLVDFERANRQAVKGLTVKELQAQRNTEYFERVKAGLVDDNPPMPVNYKPVMFGVGHKLLD